MQQIVFSNEFFSKIADLGLQGKVLAALDAGGVPALVQLLEAHGLNDTTGYKIREVVQKYERTGKFGHGPGVGTAGNGSIYQVLKELACRGCGHMLKPGELMTRHQRGPDDTPLPARGKRRAWPYCRTCYPFTVTGEMPPDLML